TVVGNSMSPTLRDGERVIARRQCGREILRGDIVVFVPPVAVEDVVYRVKRVAAIAGDPAPAWLAGDRVAAGKLVVIGDNPRSQDSRHYGYVEVIAVLAMTRRTEAA
ncbi:MAG TPA: S26 family signal peptidase, partial [Kofleriaceae bacterium]|nr:S26 family signal peptidase [Kofleriaceae bacterium]